MRLRILSDLHQEIEPFTLPEHGNEKEQVLCLAGDIGKLNAPETWVPLMKEFCARFRAVIYVVGNHELYGSNLIGWQKLVSFRSSNFYFLNNATVAIEDVLFIGATLWTDYDGQSPITRMISEQRMSDFRKIKYQHRRTTSADFIVRHQASLRFIEIELSGSQKIRQQRVVVITHHMPSFHSVAGRFIGDPLNGAFASDCDALILKYRPNIWIHGHTHDSTDYVLGDTRIICNPYGYVGYEVNPKFDPGLEVIV